MRLEKLRHVYGDEARLRIDYNQGLATFDAIRHIRDLEAFRPEFVEQPVRMFEREALAEITRAVDVPIMADESVFDVRDATRAVQIEWRISFRSKQPNQAASGAASKSPPSRAPPASRSTGGCMFETSLAHMAGTHLMAAIPNLTLGCEFYMSTYYAQEDIATHPFPVFDGHVHVPTLPGLGTAPDPEALARYRSQILTNEGAT